MGIQRESAYAAYRIEHHPVGLPGQPRYQMDSNMQSSDTRRSMASSAIAESCPRFMASKCGVVEGLYSEFNKYWTRSVDVPEQFHSLRRQCVVGA